MRPACAPGAARDCRSSWALPQMLPVLCADRKTKESSAEAASQCVPTCRSNSSPLPRPLQVEARPGFEARPMGAAEVAGMKAREHGIVAGERERVSEVKRRELTSLRGQVRARRPAGAARGRGTPSAPCCLALPSHGPCACHPRHGGTALPCLPLPCPAIPSPAPPAQAEHLEVEAEGLLAQASQEKLRRDAVLARKAQYEQARSALGCPGQAGASLCPAPCSQPCFFCVT